MKEYVHQSVRNVQHSEPDVGGIRFRMCNTKTLNVEQRQNADLYMKTIKSGCIQGSRKNLNKLKTMIVVIMMWMFEKWGAIQVFSSLFVLNFAKPS